MSGKNFGESHHPKQTARPESTPELVDQFCTQCAHNLLAVTRPLLLQDVGSDALAARERLILQPKNETSPHA